MSNKKRHTQVIDPPASKNTTSQSNCDSIVGRCTGCFTLTFNVGYKLQVQHNKWLKQHARYNRPDPHHLLSRSEQMIIFRLRTAHKHQNHHLFAKFRTGQTLPLSDQQHENRKFPAGVPTTTTASGVSSSQWRLRWRRSFGQPTRLAVRGNLRAENRSFHIE